jgi:hypothetical protein
MAYLWVLKSVFKIANCPRFKKFDVFQVLDLAPLSYKQVI